MWLRLVSQAILNFARIIRAEPMRFNLAGVNQLQRYTAPIGERRAGFWPAGWQLAEWPDFWKEVRALLEGNFEFPFKREVSLAAKKQQIP